MEGETHEGCTICLARDEVMLVVEGLLLARTDRADALLARLADGLREDRTDTYCRAASRMAASSVGV